MPRRIAFTIAGCGARRGCQRGDPWVSLRGSSSSGSARYPARCRITPGSTALTTNPLSVKSRPNRLALGLGIVAAVLGVVAVIIDLVQGDGLSVIGFACIAIGLSVVSMNVRRKRTL